MRKTIAIILLGLLFCSVTTFAQESKKSEFEQRAESEAKNGKTASARFNYIRAFEDYAAKGNMAQAVACGTKGAALYYQKENYYQEAFDLLRRIDQTVTAASLSPAASSALRYQTSKQRMLMYMKMRRSESAKEHLNIMESHANAANDEAVTGDLLYNKTIFYYTLGQTEKGNAVFQQMAARLTAQKEYGKVDEVYRTLIANGQRSGSANMVAQAYGNYMTWKDSVSEAKRLYETDSLKQQIAAHEATIADQESTLSTRKMTIMGLSTLALVLAAVLAVGAIVLIRFIVLSRKQKKIIRLANDSNALKAKFISNIATQMEPTLSRMDGQTLEVKALKDFAQHIQTLSDLENSAEESVGSEDVQVLPFCEAIVSDVSAKKRGNVTLNTNVPKMTATFNKEYVGHILHHLLRNALRYTSDGGTVTLEFKKRGPHKCQFIVADTGKGIPAEKLEDIFKPFTEVKDLTDGDGLGLPICKLMALKMKGDINIDTDYTKGTRFVLDLVS